MLRGRVSDTGKLGRQQGSWQRTQKVLTCCKNLILSLNLISPFKYDPKWLDFRAAEFTYVEQRKIVQYNINEITNHK